MPDKAEVFIVEVGALGVAAASRRLKAYLAGRYLTQIDLSSTGRPEFARPDLDFNLSHHGDFCIAIVGAPAVGIDLTYGSNPPQFTADQCANLFSPLPKSDLEFCIMWSVREAYLKSTGEGYRETPVSITLPELDSDIPDLESGEQLPTCTVENTRAFLFTLCGLAGSAVCPAEGLSHCRVEPE